MNQRRKRERKEYKLLQQRIAREKEEQEQNDIEIIGKHMKRQDRNINIDMATLNLIPQKINSESVEILQNNLMEQEVIPAHPFSALFIGMSGGGKTNTLVYMVNNFYRDYFDEIIVLGNTAKSDGMYMHLEGLEEDNIYTENLEEECANLLDDIKQECEDEGVVNCPRRLIILEDATSERKLIYSKSFIKLFVQARHLNVSILCSIHKIRAIARAARINATCLFLFRPVKSDYNVFIEEYCPPYIEKNDFKKLLNYAFTKTPDMVKPFLYYNRTYDKDRQFRKGFHEVLTLE